MSSIETLLSKLQKNNGLNLITVVTKFKGIQGYQISKFRLDFPECLNLDEMFG
jgi:hypothetical protein